MSGLLDGGYEGSFLRYRVPHPPFHDLLEQHVLPTNQETKGVVRQFMDTDTVLWPHGKPRGRQELVPGMPEGNREVIPESSVFAPAEDQIESFLFLFGEFSMEIG